MSKIYVARHGVSLANEAGIIQGPTIDSELSLRGIAETRIFSNNFRETFAGLQRIITSPAKRAKQKADIIAQECGLEVQEEPLLREFCSGVLEGLTKEEANCQFPLYLDIWHKRGDLDGIPGAETGDELQARVLLFLDRYYLGSYLNELIVSHAGYIRALVNTALRVQRNSPVDVGYSTLHLIEHPWENIVRQKLNKAKSSLVEKIETFDRNYILKKCKKKEDTFYRIQKRLSRECRKVGCNVPRLLGQKPVLGEQSDSVLQVWDFLNGDNKFGSISKDDMRRVVSTVYKMFSVLRSVSSDYKNEYHRHLDIEISNRISDSIPQEISRWGLQVLQNPDFSRMMEEELVLVNYDVNRSNTIFDGETVGIIDLDHLLYAPPEFQYGCLIASNFQFESPTEFQLAHALKYWPERHDPKRTLAMMDARAFLGAYFFVKRNDEEPTLEHLDYLQRYLHCLEQNQRVRKSL